MTPTPEEKKNELIEKFKKYANEQSPTSYDYNASEHKKNAKQCAAICVEQLIESFGAYTGMHDQEFFDSERNYWQQVLNLLTK